ncbi:MAG: cob(I)yrinic acid a,c-diamide adenosyltransferase [Alphaproteobacteria bacterium]|jgi:cob(I)alamin adenosyltransferase|nr:cob(I)yrinic acid a,c-diamide adenosyltransferase [Alphaproteobacteria bacterium]
MVKLNKIYTRTGDLGETGLGDASRISKDNIRIEAIGAVDEANAAIGLATLNASPAIQKLLFRIQNDLFDLGADLCVPLKKNESNVLRIVASQVQKLEDDIDRYNGFLTPLTSFILPGGSDASTHLHLARTIVRRAERDLVTLMKVEEINQEVLRYLNRLSDLLFVLGRYENDKGQKDVLWVPGAHR